MLNRLSISNFALIDNINLQFKAGYSVITGETGAGKSIILKALNLLLGERADYSVIRIKEKKCIIEAEFNIGDLSLESVFSNFDMDYDPITIIRREFLPTGKSRLFINDTPATLSTLKAIGASIIKIHTQHETLDLFDKQFQLNTLDSFAETSLEVQEFSSRFSNYQNQIKDLTDLELKVAEQRKTQDYTQFLIQEFIEIDIKKINIDALIDEAEQIENLEQIQNQLDLSLSVLLDEQHAPSQAIKRSGESLAKIGHLSPKYQTLLERFESVRIELDDIESELSELANDSEINDDRIAIVQGQVEAINSLLYKHNCTTGAELKAILADLESEIHSYSDLEEEIVALEKSINQEKLLLTDKATALSKKRKSFVSNFEEAIRSILAELGMPNAELKLEFKKTEVLTNNGLDSLQYLFKTNLGGQFLPVSKTASGGELSRLMLSILHIISSVQKLPTLVFDEIDTGVSGEIASKMASLFSKMGTKTQLISITHLPQIASKAKVHFHVFKTVGKDTTTTMVKELNDKERITELAKMMSGEIVSDKAIENAKLLLEI